MDGAVFGYRLRALRIWERCRCACAWACAMLRCSRFVLELALRRGHDDTTICSTTTAVTEALHATTHVVSYPFSCFPFFSAHFQRWRVLAMAVSGTAVGRRRRS